MIKVGSCSTGSPGRASINRHDHRLPRANDRRGREDLIRRVVDGRLHPESIETETRDVAPIHRIGLFRRDDFQKFCSVLLSSDDADFRAIRGDGGDLGSDGFAAGATVVYQAYAPDIVTAAKFRHKIEESLTKASRLRAQVPSLSTFRLLTPFDLTIEQELHLEVEAKKRAFKSESWGESRLLAILARHPEVNRAFSEILLPDVVDEVRQLGAALLESLPRVGTEDFEDTLGENAMFPHFY